MILKWRRPKVTDSSRPFKEGALKTCRPYLKLDTSKVKISTANGPHATILGLGSNLIVDGANGRPDVDRLALARIIRELGVEP